MTWSYFIIFAIISVVCWAVGAVASWKGKKTMAYALTGIGLAVFFTYILCMWINLECSVLNKLTLSQSQRSKNLCLITMNQRKYCYYISM